MARFLEVPVWEAKKSLPLGLGLRFWEGRDERRWLRRRRDFQSRKREERERREARARLARREEEDGDTAVILGIVGCPSTAVRERFCLRF